MLYYSVNYKNKKTSFYYLNTFYFRYFRRFRKLLV